MTEKGMRRLRAPEAAYRGKPFWSWNGKLEEKELLRQIDCMKEMGFGGFFMHARTGLETEYLGEEWFRLTRICAEYGAKRGMEAWLYDEDRWPSGTCGGTVTKNRAYRLRFLSEYDSDEAALACPDVVRIVARYALKQDPAGALALAVPVQSRDEVVDGYRYVVYAEECMQCGDFYNGAAYLDTMNPEAVEAFLRSTHERYAEECGDLLGREIRGIFTDEPHRGALFNGFGISNPNRARMIPYTGKLFAAYQKKYGKELCVPAVYYGRSGECGNETAAQYIDVLDDLFTKSFAQKYRDWCAAHGLIFTGHILHEDNLSMQSSLSGSMMRFYEYMDYPGIDNLSAHNDCYWAAIQCASVARQMGKPFVLSEMYGGTGWDMPLHEYKRIGDWHALFGVNLRCPHLSWYTMRGEAKRDYPASILHQNSWYRDWNLLETYFARIGILLTEGTRRADLLVVHPVENMWRLVRQGWMEVFIPHDERIAAMDAALAAQCNALIEAQIEFDYGDEELLQKYARVGADASGAYLRVGKAVYRTVLLRAGQAVRASTRALLQDFAARGGKILQEIDRIPRQGILAAPRGIASARRKWEGDDWLFLLNLQETRSAAGALLFEEAEAAYAWEEWDLVRFENLGPCDLREIKFAPGQMRVFRRVGRAAAADDAADDAAAEVLLPPAMPYTLSEPNVLVLDRASYCLDGGRAAGEETDVLKIDRCLRKVCGLPLRGGEMVQPWFARKYRPETDASCGQLRLRYSFFSQIEGEVLLAAEYESLCCNGEPAVPAPGRWVDACFRLFRARVRKGQNVVTSEFCFRQSADVEAIYVLGAFGVQLPATLVPLPETLQTQRLAEQGLPYYGGAVTFRTGIGGGAVRVEIQSLQGACVHAEGEEEAVIAFPPYCAQVRAGQELRLTLYLTRRNTFGPNHYVPQPLGAYGPEAWVSEGENWSDEPVLVPQGFRARVWRVQP